ncbi:polyprenyl synthetase family protein [Oryzihumus leptocrescens]|uniref:Geranylgeranyl diphosphate synthase type I n=1 Tax=Oryzihumus leptocrescens TaxID=297536 RepID=A0A542ZJJ9_9MICO|nr:polyprenyl synthetase family protein [Oryzihumus leptocrescens]TQL60532.1 geranylgeranyl diphosphate synthase type I [Oryzihumus leptocrescens]
MSSPLDAHDLRRRVQAVVDAEIRTQSAVLGEIGDDLTPLVSAVAALLRGGKRLRAAFLYWGYRAGGGPDGEAVVRAATAMELFQAAALLHDDVMDDSDTRRGLPAAHRRLATEHTEQGWTGDGDRFGVAGAILAGDLCLTWTDELFATSGLPAAELDRARPVFDRMRTQLMGGQFLDVLESARGWESLTTAERVERARRVIRYKSAKYTVEHPLLIGATAAGVGGADLAELSAYGLALGEAFQLRDDLLGVFGDPAQTGKPAGDDLREGKRTVLIAEALDTAGPAGVAAVDKLLGLADLDEAGVEELRAVITGSGALDRVEQRISALVTDAHAHLDATTGLTPEGRQMLATLVDVSTARSA